MFHEQLQHYAGEEGRRRRSNERLARVTTQGAGGDAQECGGGLSGAWRCRSRSADLGGPLQKLPEVVRMLEATTAQGRHRAELLEVRRCSGGDPEERSWLGVRWSCRRLLEKKTVAAELGLHDEALNLLLTS